MSESTETDVLVTTVEDGVATVTLNRPHRRNALSRQLVYELWDLVRDLDRDGDVRVVVLTGTGDKAFCAGADLKERRGMSEADVARYVPDLSACFTALASLSRPTIAAINGVALGGGLELALACDLRVAVDTALVGLPETHLAIIPGAGGTQRLPRLIGVARAKELIFTGRRVEASEALQLGLVNRICAADELESVTLELARQIASAGPVALAQAKFAIDQGSGLPLASGLAVEAKAYQVTIPTEDRLEALAAFREKRTPQFEGR